MEDGDTYLDRVKTYFCSINPGNLFVSDEEINDAIQINSGKKKDASYAEKTAASCLVAGTLDPVTAQTRPLLTRPAALPLLRILSLGGMLAYNFTPVQIVFWQWLHQSITSCIDYKNQDPLVSDCEVALAYTASTAGAVGTALTLRKFTRCSSRLTKRFIPLAAVAVGNAINIAMIKRRAWKEGVTVYNKTGSPVGVSNVAGAHAMTRACFGRFLQFAPALAVTPLFLNKMEMGNKFCKKPVLEAVYAFGLVSLFLYLLTPFVMGSFGEKSSVPTVALEEEIQNKAKNEKFLYYYNK